MIRVGIVGYGYWGPNLARNFAEAGDARLEIVCDVQEERLALAARRFPTARLTRSAEDVISDGNIDAVVIATPIATHFELARRALEAGRHVLVEKPLAASVAEGRRLVELARARRRVLLVDHTFVYTGAVRKIRELVARSELGHLYYLDSVRVNLGLFQHDASVLWDLAVHDVAIMDYVLGLQPIAVSATGMAHVRGQPENVAYVTMFFEGDLIAHLHVNWLAPVKVRRMLVGGDRRMIVYDDLQPDEKIKIYDRGVTLQTGSEPPPPEGVHQLLVGYRSGDMTAPKVDTTEALLVEVRHFLECVRTGTTPVTDGEAGLRVVQILAAADESMKRSGTRVDVAR